MDDKTATPNEKSKERIKEYLAKCIEKIDAGEITIMFCAALDEKNVTTTSFNTTNSDLLNVMTSTYRLMRMTGISSEKILAAFFGSISNTPEFETGHSIDSIMN